MIELVENTPAMPIHWGMNQAGMQIRKNWTGLCLETTQFEWVSASKNAMWSATRLNTLGAHKQIVNRILEPFQMIRVVCTATEYDNFFYLRYHADAQP